MTELKQRVEAKIQETLDKLDFQSGYTVVYKRMGSCCGKYNRPKNILFFDPLYLQNHTEHYLNTTVPHEVCHLVQWLKYTEAKSHGPIWKRLMHSVGLDGDRCNTNYNIVPLRRVKRVAFECNCGFPHALTLRKAMKYLGGRMNVWCRICKAPLRRKNDS